MYKYSEKPVNQEHFILKNIWFINVVLLTLPSDRREKSDEQSEPLFCGKDVARALGYTNP